MPLYSKFLSIIFLVCLSTVAFGQSEWYVAPSEGNSFGKFKRWSKDFGKSSDNFLVGDVTGDGRADAIAMDNATGDWMIADSKGKSFNKGKKRITNYAVGSSSQMIGDVNGDGKGDVVTFYVGKGEWYVALSRGGGKFEQHSRWLTEHGIAGTKQFLGDVNGDKRADAIIFFEREGRWYVSLSEGNTFSTQNIRYEYPWIKEHGIGSSNQLVGDVNGDGKADSAVFFSQTGQWYVSLSSGSSFQRYNRWIDGYGANSTAQFFGDTDGDRRADAVVFLSQYGSWYDAPSTANSFGAFNQWTTGDAISSQKQFLADVTGDGKDDAIIVFVR
jgi:hypothetical protein